MATRVLLFNAPASGSTPRWAVTDPRFEHFENDERFDPAWAEADDHALIQECRAGKVAAFDVLVERHQRNVYQLCYRFAGNHEDASDLAQDVFIRAYRALHGFKGQSAVGTWLYRIAVNLCLNRVSVKVRVIEPLQAREHATCARSPPIRRSCDRSAPLNSIGDRPSAQEAARRRRAPRVSRPAAQCRSLGFSAARLAR